MGLEIRLSHVVMGEGKAAFWWLRQWIFVMATHVYIIVYFKNWSHSDASLYVKIFLVFIFNVLNVFQIILKNFVQIQIVYNSYFSYKFIVRFTLVEYEVLNK